MADNIDYTPPLGTGATDDYDNAISRWTREMVWRRAMLDLLEPAPNERILDVGSGTGSFAILVKSLQPSTEVTGIDPDTEALEIAKAKAKKAAVEIDFNKAFAADAEPSSADAVVSSLVLHQMPLKEKQVSLVAMNKALKPGGRMVLADYGRQNHIMRLLFRLTVQRLDGVSDTPPNADGILPSLIAKAGFADINEHRRVPTITGMISIFSARKV